MRCSLFALAVVLTATSSVDAQILGRRRNRDCCVPVATCCQPAPVNCCGPAGYRQPAVAGGYAQAMPMPLTPGQAIIPAGGTQPQTTQPVTPAGGVEQTPQPQPVPATPTPPAGQAVVAAQGTDCCCGTTTVAYSDAGYRTRRGLFRRF